MKVGISIIITIIVLVSIFPISAGTDNLIYENYSSPHPLKAYPARVIPHNDGKISPGEWNDTVVYRCIKNFTDGFGGAGQESLVRVALKYDSDTMYILFTINDEKDEGFIYGDIDNLTMGAMDVITLILDYTDGLSGGDAIAVLMNYSDMAEKFTEGGRPDVANLLNDSVKNATLGMTYVTVYLNSSVNGSASSIYDNGSYVFEISLSLSYFNITDDFAPFSIFFSDKGTYTLSASAGIGEMRYGAPGVVFSSLYYSLPLLNIYHNASLSNITLLWDTKESADIEKYEILVSENPFFKENYTTRIAVQDRNITSYDIANLSNGKYYFKIVSYTSQGAYGESNTVETTINLQPSSPPANLTLSLLASQVKLSWTPPSDNGNSSIIEYKIYRGTSLNSEKYLASVNGSVTDYIDSNVSEGTTYYYKISAVNGVGESNLSEEVSIEIPTSFPGWPESSLMLAMSVTVLISAGILVAIFRRIRRYG